MIKNAYPRPFLDTVIKCFLDKKFNVKPACDTANKILYNMANILENFLKSCNPIKRASLENALL